MHLPAHYRCNKKHTESRGDEEICRLAVQRTAQQMFHNDIKRAAQSKEGSVKAL